MQRLVDGHGFPRLRLLVVLLRFRVQNRIAGRKEVLPNRKLSPSILLQPTQYRVLLIGIGGWVLRNIARAGAEKRGLIGYRNQRIFDLCPCINEVNLGKESRSNRSVS